jgi:prepilin-type processing-associated H-X9-DG protein
VNGYSEPGRGSGSRQPGGWIFCLLPYLEQKNVGHIRAAASIEADRRSMLAEMIQTPVDVFHCPSRRVAAVYPALIQPFNADPTDTVAKTDYAANAGDLFLDVGEGPVTLEQGDSNSYSWPDYKATGICYLRSALRLAAITDGTSNTYLVGEKNLPREDYYTGRNRGDDQSMYSGDDFDTLRWTSPSWTPVHDRPAAGAEARFGSAHPGGCSFAFCDGSVRAISYTIDDIVHQYLGNRADGRGDFGPSEGRHPNYPDFLQ